MSEENVSCGDCGTDCMIRGNLVAPCKDFKPKKRTDSGKDSMMRRAQIFIETETTKTKVDHTNEGKRVKLIACDDLYTKMKPGEEGTYEFAIVNLTMTQHSINWDSGSTLLLVEGHDKFEFTNQDKGVKDGNKSYIPPTPTP